MCKGNTCNLQVHGTNANPVCTKFHEEIRCFLVPREQQPAGKIVDSIMEMTIRFNLLVGMTRQPMQIGQSTTQLFFRRNNRCCDFFAAESQPVIKA